MANGRAGRALLALGAGLLLLNVVGLLSGLRSPALRAENPDVPRGEVPSVTPEAVLRAASLEGPREQLYADLTEAVHGAMAHAWPEAPAGARALNLHVPARENLWLWLAGWVSDEFARHEFRDPTRALERGVGLCSQQALVVTALLEARGVPARIVSLGGHVVVSAPLTGEGSWVLDPDYGVVLQSGVDALAAQPEQVERVYVAAGVAPAQAKRLATIYGPEQNQVFGDGSVHDYAPHLYWAERLAYGAKWLLPLLLAVPSLSARRSRSRPRSEDPPPAST